LATARPSSRKAPRALCGNETVVSADFGFYVKFNAARVVPILESPPPLFE
jgi:hypothetical protein